MEEEKRKKLADIYTKAFIIISSIMLLIVYAFPFLKLIFEILKLSLHSFLVIFLLILEFYYILKNYDIMINSFLEIKEKL